MTAKRPAKRAAKRPAQRAPKPPPKPFSAAVAMVKDEVDIVRPVVEHMLTQVDLVIVADNGSTDGTSDVLLELLVQYPGRFVMTVDEDPAYLQSEKMTTLAALAGRTYGATWVVPFDADEVWYSGWGRIGDLLADLGPSAMTATAQLYNHVATAEDDPSIANPIERIKWRQTAALPLTKVAVRWRDDLTIHMGNHGASYNGVEPAPSTTFVVRHFPYRSEEHFVRKVRNGAAAYAAAADRVPADAGLHWRQWGDLLAAHGEEAVLAIYRQWYWRAEPAASIRVGAEMLAPLIYDPAPACRPK